jgi:hypothetical protein
VKLRERTLGVLVNEEGRHVLQLAAVDIAESQFVWVYVDDSDDGGLWARVPREDGDHLVLIRWEYVLSVDIPAGQAKTLESR